ncbi:F0F1 ATP synthase subunit delta [Salipiger bermudensis]|uniref:F0F1 ATP synthase subunit delta n=1 Tax=Salipiger bermudensis TaxID=344736 RepID=UPI001C9906AA|nr:F0F1 ATP synthase subunit delta [Salipiger bermudensis]MBY6003575.1 F0F1 ATP synthase subunit delta [Salipiger bermudensis]
MTIDWWTLGLQTVNAAILIWLLARFLFRPVSKIIEKRQALAHADLDAAEAAKAAAEAERAAAEAERAEISASRAALLDAAQADAGRETERLMQQAQAGIAEERRRAEAALARAEAERRRALDAQAGQLAADIAERLLRRLPDAALTAGFIDGLVAAVAELPAPVRDRLGSDGPVPVRAARMLLPEERATLEARLAETLGRTLPLEISEDPDLIAGLELDATNAIVRNHFRADLARITAELTRHD